MADVLCLGEMLIDWVSTEKGLELASAKNFTKAPGGAPANVAVGLARLGVASAFMGCVSGDSFGRSLRRLLEDEGIDTTGVIDDPDATTRMAYVITTIDGDRQMADFSRLACADTRLRAEHLREVQFELGEIFHFGSISMLEEPARSATSAALMLAKRHGLLVSFDPNVRLSLWPDAQRCKRLILETLKEANIVKINADELEFLTGSRETPAAQGLREEHGIDVLVITRDQDGCSFFTQSLSDTAVGYTVEVVETTGAGDAFVAALLGGVLNAIKGKSDKRSALKALDSSRLKSCLRRANAVGALACTQAGAIPSLPFPHQIDAFLKLRETEAQR